MVAYVHSRVSCLMMGVGGGGRGSQVGDPYEVREVLNYGTILSFMHISMLLKPLLAVRFVLVDVYSSQDRRTTHSSYKHSLCCEWMHVCASKTTETITRPRPRYMRLTPIWMVLYIHSAQRGDRFALWTLTMRYVCQFGFSGRRLHLSVNEWQGNGRRLQPLLSAFGLSVYTRSKPSGRIDGTAGKREVAKLHNK